MQFRWEYLVAIAAAILVLMLTWFAPPMLHMSGVNALVLRAGILLLGAIAIVGLLLWARANQPALPAIEDPTAKVKASFGAGLQGGAASQDVDVLIREASSKVAAARLAAGAKLSTLPTVFLLGESGSGKTTALDQSGLDAELLAGQVFQESSVVPTRVANLWFARKTVFVEAGGPLMDDQASWVRLIKHFLPSSLGSIFGAGAKAPRAAIVCVDCEKLVREASLDRIVAQSRKLRARLEELSYHLGISLPVYVVFNRSDRIPYFEEFAGTFSNDEVSQVLGSTLPLSGAAASGVYAEQETRRLTAAFQGIFFALAECRPGLLSRERSADRQAGVYEFPREFGKLSKPLVQFLVDLCRPGHLRTGPFLRGFYFSGQRAVSVAAPGGQTMIGARSAAARPSGFNPDATSLISAQGAKTNWSTGTSLESVGESRKTLQQIFLTHIFSHVILQDRAALGASGSSVRGDFGRRMLFSVLAFLAFLWIVFTTISFVGNAHLVSAVRSASNDLSTVQNPGNQAPSAESLRRLDSLRQSLIQLREYNQNGAPWTLRWGLYPGKDIFDDARAVYFHAFDQLLFAHAKKNLMADLQAFRGVPQSNADPGAAYDSLKAYLLTTSESVRNNGDFLQNFLMKDWQRDLGELDEDHTQLAGQQFAYYSSELTAENPFSKSNDTLLVDQVRGYLNGFSGLQRLYNSMLNDARQKAKNYRFLASHPDGSDVVHGGTDVDAAFTTEGSKVMDQSIQNPKRVQGETWVLGAAASTNLSPADLSAQLRAMYEKDFVAQWRGFLNTSSVLPFHSDAEAANRLRKLSLNSSALLSLICDTSENTNVSYTSIKQAFSAPQQVDPPGCSQKLVQSSNDAYMKGLFDLQACVQDVADAPPDQKDGKKALCQPFIQAAQRSAGQIEQGLPTDAEGHMDQRVANLLYSPIKSLQALWATSQAAGGGSDPLCKPFNDLKTAYPFAAHSTRDITLDEFNKVFQPNKGVLSQFIAAHKNDLTLQSGSYIHALGSTTPMGPIFLRTLNELYALQLAIYPNGAVDPRYEYTITARLPDVGVFKTEKLSFDGQSWTISGSGGRQKFIWPGNAQGATLSMDSGGGDIDYQSEKGLWAVAHFFQVYKWTPSSTGWTIQGPLPGPGGQTAKVNGKEVDLRFEVDFKGVPLFEAGFLSGYTCSAMGK